VVRSTTLRGTVGRGSCGPTGQGPAPRSAAASAHCRSHPSRAKRKGETKTQRVEMSLLTLQNPHAPTRTHTRWQVNTVATGSADVMMLLRSAHADMTALPRVDTNCTAPSVIPTVNGNTVRSLSLRTDYSPLPPPRLLRRPQQPLPTVSLHSPTQPHFLAPLAGRRRSIIHVDRSSLVHPSLMRH
jgi:hypothetical protein